MSTPEKKKAGNTCSVPGCGKLLDPHVWMCTGHWMLVPLALRDKVEAARDLFHLQGDRRKAIEDLRELRSDAIRAAFQARAGKRGRGCRGGRGRRATDATSAEGGAV